DQNFVDATTIEIDHLETPTLGIKTFADLRQMAELTEHESGSRMIAAVRREGDGQTVSHFVSRHAARDQPRSILAPHGFGLERTCIGSESTSNRFQDVRVRDYSLKLAVLVVNECDVDRRPLDDSQHVERIGSIRNIGGRSHLRAYVRAFAAQIRIEQILRLNDA